jgi:hypothetical protein
MSDDENDETYIVTVHHVSDESDPSIRIGISSYIGVAIVAIFFLSIVTEAFFDASDELAIGYILSACILAFSYYYKSKPSKVKPESSNGIPGTLKNSRPMNNRIPVTLKNSRPMNIAIIAFQVAIIIASQLFYNVDFLIALIVLNVIAAAVLAYIRFFSKNSVNFTTGNPEKLNLIINILLVWTFVLSVASSASGSILDDTGYGIGILVTIIIILVTKHKKKKAINNLPK